ncbi:MAG: hypothetical protein ACXADA_23920 [Candidatus Hodarchaeales archaeon]
MSHVLSKILLDKAGNIQPSDLENLEKKLNLEYAKLASLTGFCEVDESYPHLYRITDFANLKRSEYRSRKLGEICFYLDSLMYPDGIANEDPQLFELMTNVLRSFRQDKPVPDLYRRHTNSYELLFWLVVDRLGQLEKQLLEPLGMYVDLRKLRERYSG